MITTFTFKGIELRPFSEGRRSVAMALGLHCFQGKKPTLMDMHLIIYVCLSDPQKLAKAYREPDQFIVEAMDWVDKNITPADYEAEANVVKEMMTLIDQARVVPKRDDADIAHPDDPN